MGQASGPSHVLQKLSFLDTAQNENEKVPALIEQCWGLKALSTNLRDLEDSGGLALGYLNPTKA